MLRRGFARGQTLRQQGANNLSNVRRDLPNRSRRQGVLERVAPWNATGSQDDPVKLDLEALEALLAEAGDPEFASWVRSEANEKLRRASVLALPHLLAIAKAAYAWADSDEVDRVLPKRCECDLLEAIDAARKGTP